MIRGYHRAEATLLAVLIAVAVAVGCDTSTAQAPPAVPSVKAKKSEAARPAPAAGKTALVLRSDAFEPGAEMAAKYTCQGDDLSPPLAWQGVPEKTASLALIVDDPDAPDPDNPRMTWVHWVLFNIPPAVTRLPEGLSQPPAGAKSGLNDWKKTGYGGPCPPIGRHRYFHKLYALSTLLQLDKPTKAELERAMQGHILQKAELIGTYRKR